MILRALRRDARGLAMVEFALALPMVLGVAMAGLELTYYTIAKMRMSQLALHVADNASRIGKQSLLTDPQISETDINDLLTGADMQSDGLDLLGRGRVIVSSLEPDPANSGKFRIHWQRCKGVKNWVSSYGVQGAANLTGMGPTGRQVTAPTGGGIIYVEIAYDYRPLFLARLAPASVIREVAAMTVRDKRDFNGNGGAGIYNVEAATAAGCGVFSAT
ncbi:MAG: TadE/TadG family type IV pilus assembly protein [Sphingobium sp.]